MLVADVALAAVLTATDSAYPISSLKMRQADRRRAGVLWASVFVDGCDAKPAFDRFSATTCIIF